MKRFPLTRFLFEVEAKLCFSGAGYSRAFGDYLFLDVNIKHSYGFMFNAFMNNHLVRLSANTMAYRSTPISFVIPPHFLDEDFVTNKGDLLNKNPESVLNKSVFNLLGVKFINKPKDSFHVKFKASESPIPFNLLNWIIDNYHLQNINTGIYFS